MKREELNQLLRDMVLASANGGHLGFDGVHVLTQGNTVLLRLILICVKPCGERMNLVCQGLSRTGGDLWVAFLRVACEAEPDRCLLAGVNFHGAMVVDLRLGIWKH